MKLEHPRLPVSKVFDADSIRVLVDDLVQQSTIGLDAERASGFRYSQNAYLIQIATVSRIYLLDPVSEQLPQSWAQEVASAMRVPAWILHSATQDLPCLAELGIKPTRVIDTELAARFLGVERFGLASLAEQFLNLELAKEHSAADWSQRPLSDSMLNYAALDVDILFELWDALTADLESSGRMQWLEQEFARLLKFAPKPPSPQPWRNLPGMVKIKDLPRLQIAKSLWTARDELARELDTAPGRLVPDRSLAAVIANPPKSKRELAGNKQFNGRASRSKLDLWWRAIESAGSLTIEPAPQDENHIPNHRSWEKRFPEAHLRLKHARAAVGEVAAELGLAPEILLTPETLRRVCFTPEGVIADQLSRLGARPWQVEICDSVISEAFEAAQHDVSTSSGDVLDES